MIGFFKIVTDGKVFRIKKIVRGGDDVFITSVGTCKALEFMTKDDAEKYVHEHLSMDGWKDA